MAKNLQPMILVVEDDESISSIIKYNLKKAGYLVNLVDNGNDAVEAARQSPPDLVLLDWMLPGMNGIDVCRALRAQPETTNIPIIMLSAKGEEIDKITGLERGADDYITKPFSPVELSARIKAVLRRIRPAFSGKFLEFEDISMDLSMHTVSRGGKELKLSPIEFKILQSMMENPGRVLSRESIMDKIWGTDIYVGTRTIDVHITRLRRSLIASSKDGKDIIKTVRLGGYALKTGKDSKE
jgi:two-component system, OmpR family, phosphate regulon response regulator PhoB